MRSFNINAQSLGCALIIDTHPLVFNSVLGLLSEMNRFDNIHVRTDIVSSLKLLAENEIDFMIMDIELNAFDIDGFEFLRLARSNGFIGKVLYLTSNETEDYPAMAYKIGANGCINQSEKLPIIRDSIEKICQGYSVFKNHRPNSANAMGNVKLSKREAVVLGYLLKGCRNTEISEHLSINPKTVSTYKTRILTKYQASSIVELMRKKVALNYSIASVIGNNIEDRSVELI